MLFTTFIVLSLGLYFSVRWQAKHRFALAGKLASLPTYYGWYALLWLLIPVAFLMCLAALGQPLSSAIWYSVMAICSVAGILMGWQALIKKANARQPVEKAITWIMWALTVLALIVIAFILSVLAIEAWHFFEHVSFWHFLTGTTWQPTNVPENYNESYGAFPLFWGTFVITCLALLIAIPLGLLSAIYLSTYANPIIRQTFRPLLETMAGIPTVVYGFFAAIFVAPIFQKFALFMGWNASSQSALAAGTVLGLMLIPMLTSLCDDVLRSVPKALKEGALGLGSTRAEAMMLVILPAAKSGLVSAILLTLSRAIGETMLVVMAAGLVANLTLNPFSSVTTVTVQIVSLLTGDQQFDSPETLSAFALGLVLFIVTLIINFLAERIQRKAVKL